MLRTSSNIQILRCTCTYRFEDVYLQTYRAYQGLYRVPFVLDGVLFCAVLFPHEMSWMRSGTD